MQSDLKAVVEAVVAGSYGVTQHARQEMFNDEVFVEDLLSALGTAELLEDYPSDPRGHSCLLLGWCATGPLHLVLGVKNVSRPVIITVYRPVPPHWLTERQRGAAGA